MWHTSVGSFIYIEAEPVSKWCEAIYQDDEDISVQNGH